MDNDNNQRLINDWYLEYSNDIYKFILYLINDHEHAKDLMQDTFIRAYNNLESFQGENKKGWLFRIARNITIDFIRSKRPIHYLIDSAVSVTSQGLTPEQNLMLSEQEKELYKAISKLKRSYREVIILRKIKEFSIYETAHILEWSEGKVKTTLWRGLSALKKQLEKEGYHYESV
ncbi:RNA polymerase sigma factor [Evansella sp. AB-P1]|uniref:RNA polymerase sigma factor n=1 Tax=Evansella sp. AB-P1 TaxID=3037653 RepID=UPI00241FB625|nr:RNA polymerase sigma factor [Evansella sp. AB-P1]MDG5790080.1 RNA polymerase sigma factor [Evansella sp. AB-P1]